MNLNIYALITVFGLLLSSPVHAIKSIFGGKASGEWIATEGKDLSGQNVFWLDAWYDPPAAGISSFQFELKYDASRWALDLDRSGLLCSFASGGGCPPVSDTTGTFPFLSRLSPQISVGSPLLGSVFNIHNDTEFGLVKVNYNMVEPLPSDAGNQNFLQLSFRPLFSLDPSSAYVTTYSGAESTSSYDFEQIGLSCNIECGSPKPFTGVTVTQVPEPDSVMLALVGLFFMFGFGRKFTTEYR
ncbi:MAG: hypothetical protein Q7U28_13880 [Aquabacterium sp.]|nr:hypothetical protein [Aquabacterium sp.]